MNQTKLGGPGIKVLPTADGSKYTRKAFKLMVMHKHLHGAQSELLAVQVQMALSTGLNTVFGVDRAVQYRAMGGIGAKKLRGSAAF